MKEGGFMPVPKKPRRKIEAAPSKTPITHAVPDRRTMEGFLAAITGGRADDALSKAQDVMYDGTVKLGESGLGRSWVGRVNARDEDAPRPDLRWPSLPR